MASAVEDVLLSLPPDSFAVSVQKADDLLDDAVAKACSEIYRSLDPCGDNNTPHHPFNANLTHSTIIGENVFA